MTSFFQFIKTKSFLKHLAIAVISMSLLFWLIFHLLGNYTLHGETIAVPDFSGLKINELDKFIEGKELNYLVIDSVYDTKSPKGIVIRQDPEANTKVKQNRTIYLYVTATLPPHIEMPKLEDKSLRQATAMIESYGLKTGRISYMSDQCANCVLRQLHKGRKIEPGTTIEKGSVIDLVVGKGLGGESLEIPCLIGLTRTEAIEKLTEFFLNAGAIAFDQPADSASAKVYKQIPACSNEATINMGSSIDLFFTNNADKIPVVPSDTTDNVNANETE